MDYPKHHLFEKGPLTSLWIVKLCPISSKKLYFKQTMNPGESIQVL